MLKGCDRRGHKIRLGQQDVPLVGMPQVVGALVGGVVVLRKLVREPTGWGGVLHTVPALGIGVGRAGRNGHRPGGGGTALLFLLLLLIFVSCLHGLILVPVGILFSGFNILEENNINNIGNAEKLIL